MGPLQELDARRARLLDLAGIRRAKTFRRVAVTFLLDSQSGSRWKRSGSFLLIWRDLPGGLGGRYLPRFRRRRSIFSRTSCCCSDTSDSDRPAGPAHGAVSLSRVRSVLLRGLRLDNHRDLQPGPAIATPLARRDAGLLALVAGACRHRRRSPARKQKDRAIYALSILGIGVAALAAVQFASPADSTINLYSVPGRGGGLRRRSRLRWRAPAERGSLRPSRF